MSFVISLPENAIVNNCVTLVITKYLYFTLNKYRWSCLFQTFHSLYSHKGPEAQFQVILGPLRIWYVRFTAFFWATIRKISSFLYRLIYIYFLCTINLHFQTLLKIIQIRFFNSSSWTDTGLKGKVVNLTCYNWS